MKLRDWLTENGVSVSAFATLIGVNRGTVYRYISDTDIPRPLLLAKIVEATGGNVEYADFATAHLPVATQ